MSRTARGEAYDAEVVLMPTRGEATYAHALFKLTYAIEPGRCTRVTAEPLLHDWRAADLDRTKIGSSDFWLAKPFTDLVVQGSVCAPGGKQVERMTAGVRLGSNRKELSVIGKREITWIDGRPRFGKPAPFSIMPATWENAYGGIDWRVAVPGAKILAATGIPEAWLQTQFDHPGMFPRNPFGTGYLVEPGTVPGLQAPTIEDPADQITPERLITGDARAWWKQPMSWSLDWTSPIMFPRACWFAPDVDPWYPAPDDITLPEVARSMISASFRSTRCPTGGVDARFFQGASAGLVISRPDGGQVLEIHGMHPDHERLDVVLPATTAAITFEIEGRRVVQAARLHHLVCRPNDLRLTMVFAAEVPLQRAFIPGIHKHIPISASLNGDQPVPYLAPVPLGERIQAALASQAPPGKNP